MYGERLSLNIFNVIQGEADGIIAITALLLIVVALVLIRSRASRR